MSPAQSSSYLASSALPGLSERILDAERGEVAVADLVERAATPERRVAQVEDELVEVVRFDTHGTGHAAFKEVTARARGRAVDVVAERQARRQRQRRAEGVVVVRTRGQAIAPAEGGREAVGQRFRIAQAARRAGRR